MRKRSIVLIHGWGADVEKLAPLARQLQKLGWSVFVPKLPGFGAPPPPTAWGVGEYVEFVLERTKKRFAGKKFFVFGHSFGGRIAIKLAVANLPEVTGAVLCASSGISRANIAKRFVFATLAGVARVIFSGTTASWWRKLLYKLAREHDYEKASAKMKEVFQKVVSEEAKADVYSIEVPLLVLWGDQDRMVPVGDAYWIERANPRSKLVVFENEGHRLPYDQPTKVAREVDKWAKSIH